MWQQSQQPPLQHQPASNYSQSSHYSQPQSGVPYNAQAAPPVPSQGPTVMSNQDFLSRVEACRRDITSLSGNISQIASLHQRAISSPDGSSSSALENLVSQTQILNTRIKDQIKYLETDAARSGGAVTKDSQIRSLKNQFKNQLEQYQSEEQTYRKRYQEQIARQYRIVNPSATDAEVEEAATANWGDEGVFQTAVSVPYLPKWPFHRLPKL
jgi:syntaxin 1B/2/3